MKHVFFMLIMILTLQMNGQERTEAEYETIFSKRVNRDYANVRGYGGLIYTYSPIFNDKKAYHFFDIGIRGGITIKRKYSIGFVSDQIGLSNNHFPPLNPVDERKSIFTKQNALEFIYRHHPEKAFHVAYGLMTGILIIQESTLVGNNIYESNNNVGFMVNPHLRYELNLMSWLSLNGSMGYRLAAGKEKFGLDIGKDLSGLTFQIGLNFGKLR